MSSKRTSSFGKTNDFTLQGYLRRIFRTEGRDVDDVLTRIGMSEWPLPFNMGGAQVVYERVPVVPSIISPQKGDLFDQVMSEAEPEYPVLWTDSYLGGQESLFVAMSVEADQLGVCAQSWLAAMRRRELLIGRLRSGTHVIACRLECFSG